MNSHVALLCDLEGRVLEVLRSVHELAPLRPGAALTEIVDEGSRDKVHAFLGDLQASHHAAGWEVIIQIRGRGVPFALAGARHGDRLLILATSEDSSVIELVEQLSRINNEQSNALRAALKSAGGLPPTHRDLFLEMSRLNSELATTQRELTRQNLDLQRLIREKNELLGMVAHDLRNPLAGISGVAEQLAHADDGLAARHRDMLEYLQDSSSHLLAQIEDLLDLTTLEAGVIRLNLRASDLLALVERCARLARELARDKGITLELELKDIDAPRLRAAALDPHKVTQALTNLLTNAIKFSSAGGVILLRLEGRQGRALITVQDHGVGIAADRLPGIFEPFQRGHSGTLGERSTGLGLAIVRRLMRAHGGEVQVQSQLGRGTTFTVTLPLRAPETAPPAAEPAARARAILIADDDPINNILLSRALEERGHSVTSVSDALAALDRLARADFELLIVDLEMPGGGGARVAEHLRRSRPDDSPPIVALSAHIRARAAGFAEQHGFTAVLSKPLRPADLDALLASLWP